jgi:hypothetical protein
MKRFVTHIITLIKLIPCVFKFHDYTSDVKLESYVYDGKKIMPRLVLFTCSKCGSTKFEARHLDQTNIKMMYWP